MMLSAMHKRETIYNLLLNTYGADPNLRDYSGKKAEYYHVPPSVDIDIDLDIDHQNIESAEDQYDGKILWRSGGHGHHHFR